MGLIKAAAGAIGSTLTDQWKEAIRCPEMGNEILMKKVTTPTGVISNGSTVIVGPGQCAIIYDNGKIVDASAEEGFYTFDSSSTPSLFAGQFGEMFKEMWTRFTFNGATSKEQAVYFFNIKEIIGNRFGTPSPIPYKDWGHPLMNARTNSYIAMTVKIKCSGKYTFQIADPFLFMSRIAGLSDVYKKDDIVEQIRSEVIGAFRNVLNSLGSDEYKIEAMDLSNKTDEIKQIMDKEVFDQPIRDRGLKILSFVVENLDVDEASQEKFDKYEVGGDAYQQQGELVTGFSEGVVNASKNSAGAMNGFMGMGMLNMTSGNMFGGVATNSFAGAQPMQPNPNALNNQPQQPVQAQPVAPQPEAQNTTVAAAPTEAQSGAVCSQCGQPVAGKFCANCGTPVAPAVPQKKFCTNCGAEVTGNFCTNCGTKA